MEAVEICPLSRNTLGKMLADRDACTSERRGRPRRKAVRWPFPGTVELWIPDELGLEHYTLATSLDLSLDGVGIRCDEALEHGLELAVAIHEPEASFHGRAAVRHCTEIEDEYLIGLQFLFKAI